MSGTYRTIVADPPWDMPKPCALPYDVMTTREICRLPVRDLTARDGTERHLYLWTTSHRLHDAFHVLARWGFYYSATLVWCKPARPVGGRFPSNVEYVLFGRKPSRSSQSHDVVDLTSRISEVIRGQGYKSADLVEWTGVQGAWKWMGRSPKCSQIPTLENWEKLVERVPGLAGLDGEVRHANSEKKQTRTPNRSLYQQGNSRWFEWPNPRRHSQKPEAFYDLVEHVSPGPYLELFARRQRLGWDTWGNEALNHVEMAS